MTVSAPVFNYITIIMVVVVVVVVVSVRFYSALGRRRRRTARRSVHATPSLLLRSFVGKRIVLVLFRRLRHVDRLVRCVERAGS